MSMATNCATHAADNNIRFNWALPLLTGSIDDTADRRARALALALGHGLDGVEAVDVAIAATAPDLLAPAQSVKKFETIMSLTGYQIAALLDYVWPDRATDHEQGETQINFWERKATEIIDGEDCPAGLYFYYEDCPEEGSIGIYDEVPARASVTEPVQFLVNGARFKMNFNGAGNVTCFNGYRDQLQGQWVALVDAANDKHQAMTAPATAVAHGIPIDAYKSFCALRDSRKPGAEAPTYTEAQAFALALQQQPAPVDTPTQPPEETTMSNPDLFVTTPVITLPNGVVVQPFQVGMYLTGTASNRPPVITADAEPLVEVDFFAAQTLAGQMGYKLITELQYLAIAHDIAGQDINWTGGKVGEGSIYQGLHQGTVDEAQPGTYVSDEPAERRWHELSNGARVYDFAGNAYSWVFDDVQGDEKGLVAKAFAADSPSIATAPYASLDKGMGWRPRAGADWSGDALVRGGYWYGGDDAGVFYLDVGSPGRRSDHVGFRCTK